MSPVQPGVLDEPGDLNDFQSQIVNTIEEIVKLRKHLKRLCDSGEGSSGLREIADALTTAIDVGKRELGHSIAYEIMFHRGYSSQQPKPVRPMETPERVDYT